MDSPERFGARTPDRSFKEAKRHAALFDAANAASFRLLQCGDDRLRIRDVVFAYLENIIDRDECGEWRSCMRKYPAELYAHTEQAEGRIPWMYLDTRGNVTCAMGHLLADPAAALRLPWVGGDPAAEWGIVKRAIPGLKASAYQGLTQCRLSNEAMDAILDADLDIADLQLAGELPGFSQWPGNVRIALTDMGLNLGAHGLLQYRRMLDDIREGNFAAAAVESARNGVSTERNDWTRRMIASASLVIS